MVDHSPGRWGPDSKDRGEAAARREEPCSVRFERLSTASIYSVGVNVSIGAGSRESGTNRSAASDANGNKHFTSYVRPVLGLVGFFHVSAGVAYPLRRPSFRSNVLGSAWVAIIIVSRWLDLDFELARALLGSKLRIRVKDRFTVYPPVPFYV
ncbi:hypothetical protein R1flu_027900 [Riccia fluitans]|uniref:Uncharacterized protein n=1 Tax=Riccia fluitans TaxID=41844 RepID=A0ABD1XK67_9MARC